MLLNLPIYDTQCGAKLFRATPELEGILAEPFQLRWIFDVEIIARLIRSRRITGGEPVERSIYEVPLRQWVDVRGSKVRLSCETLGARLSCLHRRPASASPSGNNAAHTIPGTGLADTPWISCRHLLESGRTGGAGR
jgi:hypothetical protein